MGITIHYQLRLRDANAMHGVIEAVRDYADTQGWPTRDIATTKATLSRTNEESVWDYEGPSAGIEVLPDELADPVRFEFGTDLVASDFTKTQFAGSEIHQRVIHLLDALRPHVAAMEVVDEGEYWELRDTEALERAMATCGRLIRETLAAHPTAKGPIRLSSGRWADIIT